MKRKLISIAKELTEEDIQEIIRLKRSGGKRAAALNKKREKLLRDLEAVNAEIEQLTGEAPSDAAPRRKPGPKPGPKTGNKPGPKPAAKTAMKKKTAGAKKRGPRSGGRMTHFNASLREVLLKADTPLRARDIVDGLPGVGVKVKNAADMRKRVSVALAQQTNTFEKVERGVYQLKDSAE